MSHDKKLVYMANQIGKFFASQGGEQAVTGTEPIDSIAQSIQQNMPGD